MTYIEADVKEAVKKYLDEIGAVWFMPVQAGFGNRAVDFLVCYRGFYLGIETKAKGKKPTGKQKDFLRRIKEAEGWACIEDDPTLPVLRSVIKAMDLYRHLHGL